MVKKLICVFLSVCLLIPTMGWQMVQTADAAGEYVLKEFDYRVSGVYGGGDGVSFSVGTAFDPIDLTAYGFPKTGRIAPKKLGFSFDLYISGDKDIVNAYVSRGYGGWIEMTSSGSYDVEEFSTNSSNLVWKADKWNRYVLDLANFSNATSGGNFNPEKFNFFRIYTQRVYAPAGQTCAVKICNMRLVDMTQTAPSYEELPLGDGSFKADEPEWRQITAADGYTGDEVIVAGYDLCEYVEDHKLKVKDYAPIIQSLLDGLGKAGGGALFIPEGHYPCYSSIVMPAGVTIYGVWNKPEEDQPIGGTVLDVYVGRGNVGGTPFIRMGTNSLIKGLAFWYPEQTDFGAPEQYPPTVKLSEYCFTKNATFVNSYLAIEQGPDHSNCPNAENIYGTPLFCGIDADGVVDIMRLEEIHFSPEYWIHSGLEGAPSAQEDAKTLRNYLYYNAAGITLRRIDWSYLTYTSVSGYATGVVFAKSNTDGSQYPNGQCHHLHITHCRTGLYAESVHGTGEMVTSSVFDDCGTAVWLGESNSGNESAVLQLIDVDITADTAICNQQTTLVLVLSSRIHKGDVTANCGWYSFTDTTFPSEAPQVVLESGSMSAVFTGCADADGTPITVENEGLCPLAVDPTVPDVPNVTDITPGQGTPQVHGAAKKVAYIAEELDATGKTDVTGALQKKLDNVKKYGGGVVYLPGGRYRLNGSVTVPTGVELRGCTDFGRIPYNVGTILDVYATDSSEPTVILEEAAGIRGVVFNYPEQYHNALFETEKKFTEYPYTIQGRGADVYIINTAIRNGWNGIDLMTYRCDRHYVDYACGLCFNNFIKVGHGAVDGVLRNYQVNYNAVYWEGEQRWGNWAKRPLTEEEFGNIMRTQLNNHATVCLVGDVDNELIYDSFNYSGCYGLQFVAEESGAADALVYGHGIDYGTVDVDVEAAEALSFVNLQLTSFNQVGGALEKDMYDFRLGEEFDGTVTVVGMTEWADPTKVLDVENGTLEIYGFNMASSSATMAEIADKATLRLRNVYLRSLGKLKPADANLSNIFINSGFRWNVIADEAQLGECQNVLHRLTYWDVPQNAQIDQSASMVFTDAFSNGEKSSFGPSTPDGASAQIKNGQCVVSLGTASSSAMFTEAPLFEDGTDKSLYYMELRVQIPDIHAGTNTRALLILCSDEAFVYPMTFGNDGKIRYTDGEEQIALADYETETWYRVAVELDMRDPFAKAFRTHFMDDEYHEIAVSPWIVMPEELQEKGHTFYRLWLGCMTEQAAAVGETTSLKADYLFITQMSGTLGDVNGDGKIDSTDARLILQYYAKKIGEDALNVTVADVNGDGKVDSTDARLILQYYAKKINSFS